MIFLNFVFPLPVHIAFNDQQGVFSTCKGEGKYSKKVETPVPETYDFTLAEKQMKQKMVFSLTRRSLGLVSWR